MEETNKIGGAGEIKSKGKIIDSMIQDNEVHIHNGYIAVNMNWSEVKDCEIHYEDNTEMELILLWAVRGDTIVHGWTIKYEVEMNKEEDLEWELNRSFDEFLDEFLSNESGSVNDEQ